MDVDDEVTPMVAPIINDWAARTPQFNDAHLRHAFNRVLAESQELPPEEKLIMYDACDEHEVRSPLGPHFRRRLDSRRNTKPKKPNEQLLVCTPFNPDGFHFGKIRNPGERLLTLTLQVCAPRVGTHLLLLQSITP